MTTWRPRSRRRGRGPEEVASDHHRRQGRKSCRELPRSCRCWRRSRARPSGAAEMTMKLRIVAALVGVLALWLASDCFYAVDEMREALLVRQGLPIGVYSEPGLKFKLPLLDRSYSSRSACLSSNRPSSRSSWATKNGSRATPILPTAFPNLSNITKRSTQFEEGQLQLAQIVSSVVRRELGQVKLSALLSDERSKISDEIHAEVSERIGGLGVEGSRRPVASRRPAGGHEPGDLRSRMKSERQREAKELPSPRLSMGARN